MGSYKVPLDGKVAIVTGAGRGIGREIALIFAEAGARVVVNDLGSASNGTGFSQAEADGVIAEIKKSGGVAVANYGDAGSVEGVDSIIGTAMDNYGRIDILVNNAGLSSYEGYLMDAKESDWDLMMNVNLKGPFLLSQRTVKIMKERGGGNIINISSVGGIKAYPHGIYCISKAGINMLTMSLAKECGQFNIRVNAIAPGLIKTRFSEALWKEQALAESVVKTTALNRWGEPIDIAELALFLVSDAARHITGDTIVVDGGEMVGPPPQF